MNLIFKFRPLASCEDFKKVQLILEDEKFWFSPLWDQNDSMEAVYSLDQISSKHEKYLCDEKLRSQICSFSSVKGLHHPLMWAHYASGFKGIAIGVRPDPGKVTHEVIYRADPTIIPKATTIDEWVHTIVTSKSKYWEHESELRIIEKTPAVQKVGTSKYVGDVQVVILGKPYASITNYKDIYSGSKALQSYQTMARKIIDLALKKGLSMKVARLLNTPTGPVVEIVDHSVGDFDFSSVTGFSPD